MHSPQPTAVKGSLTPRLKNGAPLTAAGRREIAPPWRKRKKKGLSFPGFIGSPPGSANPAADIAPHRPHRRCGPEVRPPSPAAELAGRGTAGSHAAGRHLRTNAGGDDARSRSDSESLGRPVPATADA